MLEPSQFFWTIAGFAFVFGALIGSFLNVVIHRLPEGESIVRPPSHCPSCEARIRWYDNIPIGSWIVLGGECRHCGEKISLRYAVVEALTGGLAVAVWHHAAGPLLELGELPDHAILMGLGARFFLWFGFVALLIAMTFIDLDHLEIPHELTLPGIGLGIASPWIAMAVWGPIEYLRFWPPVTPTMSLAGAIAGGLIIIAVFLGYLAVRGIQGIGGGDVTIMAMVGAWLGWPAIFFILFAASLQGLLAAGLGVLLGNRFVRDGGEVFADDDDEPAADGSVEAGEESRGGDELEDAGEAEDAGEDGETAEPGEDPEVDETIPHGKLAVPFGPFISLAALEFLLLGPYLPPELTMAYFYW